jgi:ribonuclease Z
VEKERDRNILPQKLEAYNIPTYAINSIKKGNDFITEQGETIPCQELTKAPPKPLSYAFCSDTAYAKRTAQFVGGVDVLYHESTFLEEDKARAKKTKHSTAQQAARVALEANARHLLLGHYSARVDAPEQFANEAKSIFPEVTATRESMRIIASPEHITIED